MKGTSSDKAANLYLFRFLLSVNVSELDTETV